MHILSFDTSSSDLHVSLLVDRQPVLERTILPAGAERQEVASVLMMEVDRAFCDAGWSKSQPNLVVVGIGPGSFTGIRVAVITARTICQIFHLPLIGVSLLETLYFAAGSAEPAAILLPSTSNQFFYGAFERTEADPVREIVRQASGPADALLSQLSGIPTWFGATQSSSLLQEHELEPLPKLKNIGTLQAQLAFDRLSLNGFSTETFAWQNVLPLYLRSPSVTIKKNYAAPDPAHEPR